jgi:hypothetical protein
MVQQNGIAIGRRARDGVGRDAAACAGAVLDDHRLLENFLHPLGEDAGHDVARPARREAEHQRDRFGWELGRARRRQRTNQRREASSHHHPSLHCILPVDFFVAACT